ncbi:unnamed protein product [Echinostoma caproni]|uniref:MPHOSPH9 n=1 Tax=Echinostoma caproni TaxID=27848 RepID=A0A183BCY8_9TREM|nr:unnamed protein product [Echinostoma caproni]
MSEETGNKGDIVPVEDSFEESEQSDFRLFQAYREGNLNLDVLSTQPSSGALEHSARNSQDAPAMSNQPPALPRSWAVVPNNPNAKLDKILTMPRTLGALCKSSVTTQSISSTVTTTEPGVSRSPYTAPVDQTSCATVYGEVSAGGEFSRGSADRTCKPSVDIIVLRSNSSVFRAFPQTGSSSLDEEV